MFIIGTTKLLQKELKNQILSFDNNNSNPIFEWHAHLFKISRFKCVLLTNVLTRYSIFLFNLKRTDLDNFNQLLINSIRINLINEGIDEILVNKYLFESNKIIYTNTYNRSVLGSINENIFYVYLIFKEIDIKQPIDTIYFNKKINSTIIKPINYEMPISVMKTELFKIYG